MFNPEANRNRYTESGLRTLVTFRVAIAVLAATTVAGTALATPACPPMVGGRVIFPDGTIAMNTKLEVNPDGAAASYAPGDRGYTYLSNGVNLIDRGRKISCSSDGNAGRCRREWARAEQAGSDKARQNSAFSPCKSSRLPPELRQSHASCRGEDATSSATAREGRFPAHRSRPSTVDSWPLTYRPQH